MAKRIVITDDTYTTLRAKALEPKDSFDTIIRRLLGVGLNPARRGAVKPARVDKRQIKPSGGTKYLPLLSLAVGETVLLSWVRDDRGNAINAQALGAAVRRASSRTGHTFQTQGRAGGLDVKRLT